MEASDAAAMDISDEATVETVDDGYYTEKEFEDKLGDDGGQADGTGMLWNCEWLTWTKYEMRTSQMFTELIMMLSAWKIAQLQGSYSIKTR